MLTDPCIRVWWGGCNMCAALCVRAYMRVYSKTHTSLGDHYNLSVSRNETVASLLARLHEKYGLHPDEHQLVSATDVLCKVCSVCMCARVRVCGVCRTPIVGVGVGCALCMCRLYVRVCVFVCVCGCAYVWVRVCVGVFTLYSPRTL